VAAGKSAFLWSLLRVLSPASPASGFIMSLAALLVSVSTLQRMDDQNALISSQRELEVHSMLIERNARLLEFMVQYPEQRAHFYDNVSLDGVDTNARQRAMTLAEMWTDLFEQVLIQLENLPSSMAPTWRQYAADMYDSSPAIRGYFADASGWYIQELRDLWLASK